MTNREARKWFARLAKHFAEQAYPVPLKRLKLVATYLDDAETVIPILASEGKKDPPKDADAKKKILAVAPSKDQQPISAKKLFSTAGVGANHWSRAKLWELVEEGELASSKGGFRRAR